MIRNVDINDISDGHLYGLNDQVLVGCDDCKGCSSCCRHMGNSILLDPLDIHRLSQGLSLTFDQMIEKGYVELSMVDGAVLPHIRLTEKEEACPFLNEEGRCSIHALRPGLCRLFPLGRYYQDGFFSYILQTGECKKGGTYPLKVRQWVDTPNILKYDRYICDWHFFIKAVGQLIPQMELGTARDAALYVLRLFFGKAYDPTQDFYPQFYQRLASAKEILLS